MSELLSTAAIAHVFPEGQKITGFTLVYDRAPDPASVSPEAFSLLDRSLEPAIPAQEIPIVRASVHGATVTLETDPGCRSAWAIMNYTHSGCPNPYGPPLNCPGGPPRPPRPAEPPKGGPDPKKMGYTGPKPLNIEVKQILPLHAADGTPIPETTLFCTELNCPETERFRQDQFEDLPYTLHVPDPCVPGAKYPLVLFVPDASARGTDPTVPLRQGIGGVIWASPEGQAKHPCFVVCPAFAPDELLTHDDFTCHPKLYRIRDLILHLLERYPIDPDRIYTTGQSMGCMTSCELMCAFPDLFAGAVLVAGQWDPVRCGKAMAQQNLWILVSENDIKAHPGMDAVTAAIEAEGGTVARSLWDAGLEPDALDRLAREALETPANVRYTLFAGDSVVPPDEEPGPGSNHTCTWRRAYQIPAVRDWLFSVRRNPAHLKYSQESP